MKHQSVRRLFSRTFELAEGPVWYQNHFHWVDILSGLFYRCPYQNDELVESEIRSLNLSGRLSFALPTDEDSWIGGTESGLVHFDIEQKLKEENFSLANVHKEGRESERFNDGKVSPWGELYAGTYFENGIESQSQFLRFQIDADESLLPMMIDGQVTCSNGIEWSRDANKMYYIDSPARGISVYETSEENFRPLKKIDFIDLKHIEGLPDGMTIDREGHLWIAMWSGGCLLRFDPKSKQVVEKIDLPVNRPTSCVFGGADLKTLFITSTRENMSESELRGDPLAGSLFALETSSNGFRQTVLKTKTNG